MNMSIKNQKLDVFLFFLRCLILKQEWSQFNIKFLSQVQATLYYQGILLSYLSLLLSAPFAFLPLENLGGKNKTSKKQTNK